MKRQDEDISEADQSNRRQVEEAHMYVRMEKWGRCRSWWTLKKKVRVNLRADDWWGTLKT